jgi:hypothetical protein
VAGATAALHLLGVGGYRAGFLWLFLALPAAATAIAFLLLEAAPNRGLWAAVVAILALTVAAKLVDLAPDSAGRLEERLDGLELPLFTRASDTASGHGWCRPHCPTVTRRYRTPSSAPRANELTILLALQAAHLSETKAAPPALPVAGRPVTIRTDRLRIDVRVAEGSATIRFTSRR